MMQSWINRLRMRFWILPRMHRTYSSLTIKETFQKVYESKAWGGQSRAFYSGTGSAGSAADRYCQAVAEFIREHDIQSVVDLGCGDFQIGRKIAAATGIRYAGVDVVPELIDYHRKTVNDPNVRFSCLDICSDPLPQGDLCLVRQVLQHLSNDEIGSVLANIRPFPAALISEDVPMHPKIFNRDKPHGPDVRSYFGSGVYPDQPPFSVAAEELWNISLSPDSVLRTVLLRGTESASAANDVQRYEGAPQ